MILRRGPFLLVKNSQHISVGFAYKFGEGDFIFTLSSQTGTNNLKLQEKK